jgi:probable HAF family extracellular repeat protein
MKSKHRLRIIAPVIALLLIGLLVLVQRRHVQLYKVTVLPSLGGTRTRPEAINDRGQIAGLADVAGGTHLFLWDRENGMQDLGPTGSGGVHINSAGQVAGTMTDPNGNGRAFLWDPKDGKQMLGTLGGTSSIASELNNRGQVVGTLNLTVPRPRGIARRVRQAFIWDKATGMRRLYPNEQWESGASAINDDGLVMGFMGNYKSHRRPELCFWDSTDPAGHVPPLHSPINYSNVSDLNNNGYVLGKMYHLDEGGDWDKDQDWTFLWRKGTSVESIEYLFPLEHSVGPLKFNDANQVLYGEKHISSLERFSKKYFGPYTQYCLWDPKRGKIVLDDQIPREMGKLLNVRAINNKGCIVGVMRLKSSGNELGVLLEPIADRWDN